MGLGFDFILGDISGVQGLHEHGGADWIAIACALLVIGLMLFLSARRIRRRIAERTALQNIDKKDLVLKVEGMTCQHCVARVKKTLEGFDAVEEATPSLSSGQVCVRGDHLDAAALVQAVEKAGYKVVD